MNVLFYAHDAGGANAIAPLIPHFDNTRVFAGGPALNILPKAQDLPKRLELLPDCADFVITGTSGDDFSERHIWKTAAEQGIPCMAILDSWINYGVRLSKHKVADVHMFNGACEFLPDFYVVPDEVAKAEAIKEGVPESIIHPLGNPHFETLASRKMLPRQTANDKIRILFASQPFFDKFRSGQELTALGDFVRFAKEWGGHLKNWKLL